MEENQVVEVVEDEEADREEGESEALVLPPGLKKPQGVVAAEYTLKDKSGKPVRIVMWELSLKEELLANKRARGGDVGIQLLRLSIRAIDDEVVEWKDGAGDAMLDRLFQTITSSGRSLLVEAWRRQCTPTPEETEDFFASVKTGV